MTFAGKLAETSHAGDQRLLVVLAAQETRNVERILVVVVARPGPAARCRCHPLEQRAARLLGLGFGCGRFLFVVAALRVFAIRYILNIIS